MSEGQNTGDTGLPARVEAIFAELQERAGIVSDFGQVIAESNRECVVGPHTGAFLAGFELAVSQVKRDVLGMLDAAGAQ